MTGNVREWVFDTWRDNYNDALSDGSAHIDSSSSYRVIRGGSYADNADALHPGARKKLSANTADIYTGFRVVQEPG
jgi:formylglycine-generating enzyme required for sulfatase activity